MDDNTQDVAEDNFNLIYGMYKDSHLNLVRQSYYSSNNLLRMLLYGIKNINDQKLSLGLTKKSVVRNSQEQSSKGRKQTSGSPYTKTNIHLLSSVTKTKDEIKQYCFFWEVGHNGNRTTTQ